jgi:predicted O-methyltransferase YrrM
MKRNQKVLRVLRSLEKMGLRHFVHSIGPVKGKILTGIIDNYKPTQILEIGTLYGYSAILMANSLNEEDNNSKPEPFVTTIEIDKENAIIAKKNVQDAGLSQNIEAINGNALEVIGNALEVIPTLEKQFDFLFLDATKVEYLAYLKVAEGFLHSGAVVVADNVGVSRNEMSDYLEYVRNSGSYDSKTIQTRLEFTENVKDAMEVSFKIE